MYDHQLITSYMEAGRFTVQSLAEKIRMSTNTISRARAGKNVSVQVLTTIANAIGLPMQLLFKEATIDARSNGANGKD